MGKTYEMALYGGEQVWECPVCGAEPYTPCRSRLGGLPMAIAHGLRGLPEIPKWIPGYAGNGPVLHNGEPYRRMSFRDSWVRITWEEAADMLSPDTESEAWDE